MMSLKMSPIDFGQDGKPKDQRLCDALQQYAKKEFGAELVFPYYARVWAVEMVAEDGAAQVIGALGMRQAIDCCMFHVTPPSASKDGLRIAQQARDAMIDRGKSYLADLGNTGTEVLIFVSEEAQRYWKPFLKSIGASPANRFQIKI
jgi:hypothetical protein